tara:strand:+ start:870 stop:1028 length:159 start_codon:yes stop_codon:yes gene_type:complete
MNKRERDIMRDKMFEDLVELASIMVENQKTMMKILKELSAPKISKKTKRSTK